MPRGLILESSSDSRECQMAQHRQILKLRTRRSDGKAVWAYRNRVDGRWLNRAQVGAFAPRADTERDPCDAMVGVGFPELS